MKTVIEIKNLYVSAKNQEILKDINIAIYEGEIHALLGPNGNGKSTLLQTIMGNSSYQITKGSIKYLDNKIINEISVTERAKMGIFLTFQNPIEVEGVVNLDFLRTFINVNEGKKTSLVSFYNKIQEASKSLKLPHGYLERYVNFGFSGGEKKNNELLQLRLRKPKLALVDEIDSGLDVDSLKVVTNVINDLYKAKTFSSLIVSHYDKLYNEIEITKFHVIINGTIICSGGYELLKRIQINGFDWIYRKYNLKQTISKQQFLDTCGITEKAKQ